MRRLFVFAALLVAPTALSAPPTPDLVVKYRHNIMSGLGAHMASLSMIVKGETDRTGDALFHATAVQALAATTGALFPAGTGPGVAGFETDAKAEIWSQADVFATKVKAFETESAKLVEAAKGTDPAALKTALGAVGRTCGDCHDTFKVDDHH